MKKLRAAVIGLGQIGMGYDYSQTDNQIIASHASAFHYLPAYQLVGGVDSDEEQRKAFTKKYSQPAFSSVAELMEKAKPEVVAVAVPTKLHSKVFSQVITAKPKAIICEKPIAADLDSAKKMTQAADCPVLVNYPRRFEPGAKGLRELIKSDLFGEIYKGVVFYSKGILNNGSHYIDLLLWLLGEVTEIKVLANGRKINDYDSEPDVMIRFGKAAVYFLACQEESFSVIDLELIGTKGKIDYKNFGATIKYQTTQPDPVYPGYTILAGNEKSIKTDLNRSQWYVAQDLADYLTGKTTDLVSSMPSALKTMEVIDEIFKQRKKGVS